MISKNKVHFLFSEAINSFNFSNTSCAFGVFDGVHLGHQYLINQAICTAKGENLNSVILTFDIDPDEIFAKNKLSKLMTNKERISALLKTGVDNVVVLKFDRAIYSLSSIDFLNYIFRMNVPSHMYVGNDFKFGSKASGTGKMLKEWGLDHNMNVHLLELVCVSNAPITSTRIRKLLSAGKTEEANALLGRNVHTGFNISETK